MGEENRKNDFSLWFKSGLIVGGITILGYFFGFSYENGYAFHYGIPTQLIKVDLINIFISIISLGTLLFILLQIISLGYLIFNERKGAIKTLILSSTPSILYSCAFLYIYLSNVNYNFLPTTIILSLSL